MKRVAPPAVLAAVCVAALVAATVAAMVVTQRLRQEGTIVSRIKFREAANDPGRYRICFQLPRDDVVDVAVVEAASEEPVKVILDEVALDGDPPGDEGRPDRETVHCFDWDGTTDAGVPAAPGNYRLRVALREADRVGISGERLEIEPPEPL
jgi:hypothetical protein